MKTRRYCQFRGVNPVVGLGTLFLVSLCSTGALAQSSEAETEYETEENGQHQESSRIYRSPEERREAGIGVQLTPWLKVSALMEFEREETDEHLKNQQQGITHKIKERPSQNLQLGLDLSLTEDLEAELVVETEKAEHSHTKLDEVQVSYDMDDWGLTLGRHYVPFGEYYSHFVVGPVLEFGETRGTALEVDYSFSDFLEVSAFVLESDVNTRKKSNHLDWGLAIEWMSTDEAIRLGASYLSDLAESEEALLAEDFDDVYQQRIGAWSLYALFGWQQFEVTAEMIQATGEFDEFDAEFDRPSAQNLEIAYFPWHNLQVAARWEHSSELEDAPQHRYGLAVTWLPMARVSLALEYLRGEYKTTFAEGDDDDEDHVLFDTDTVAAQLVIEF